MTNPWGSAVVITVGLAMEIAVIACAVTVDGRAEPDVGSWQSWHVPRLSTLSSRLSPAVVELSGYGTFADVPPDCMTALVPCAT